MFKKQYVFETKRTKSLRYLKNFSSLFVFLGLAYLLTGVFALYLSKRETQLSKETFFKSPPDLIVVFTGDKGRIPFAFKISKELHRPQIFITGVDSRNTVETLIAKIRKHSELNPDMLVIDYGARNTLENVVATLGHLRNQKAMKRILIVSHDYHIMRIKMIFNTVRSETDQYQFFYMGKNSKLTSLRSLRVIFKEVYKIIRTFFFLLMW